MLEVRLRTLCRDVQAGHRLALGIDTQSVMYGVANPAADLRVTLSQLSGAPSGRLSELRLPFL